MSVGFRYILFTTRSPSVHLRVFLPGTSNPSLTLPCEKHGPRIWCHGRVLSTVAGEKITPNTENGEDGEPAWVDARPFREIPGPRGWPFIGVLRDYTKGKMVLFSQGSGADPGGGEGARGHVRAPPPDL